MEVEDAEGWEWKLLMCEDGGGGHTVGPRFVVCLRCSLADD